MIKIILKQRKESDTYLTQVCRHRWSFQPTLWLSSAVEVVRQVSLSFLHFNEIDLSESAILFLGFQIYHSTWYIINIWNVTTILVLSQYSYITRILIYELTISTKSGICRIVFNIKVFYSTFYPQITKYALIFCHEVKMFLITWIMLCYLSNTVCDNLYSYILVIKLLHFL